MPAGIFSHVKGVLIDINGVLHNDGIPIPGAIEIISLLKERSIPCRFTTNTTTRTSDDIWKMLRDMGFSVEKSEIITPVQGALLHLRQLGQPSCHLLLRDELKPAFSEFTHSHTNPDVIVVGDIGDRWNYPIMNHLFQMMVFGAELVALHRGRYWQVKNELKLDIGAFIAGLEYASGKEAVVIGKPSKSFFQLPLAEMGIKPEEAVMIGDDIEMDVGGAQKAGLKGILVKSGKYRPELAAASKVRPDAILDSLTDLKKFFIP